MKNKIFVINLRRLILVFGMFCLLIVICMGGDFVVSNVIETNASSRLLPIYSVETADKTVALTFDCAWSRSQ